MEAEVHSIIVMSAIGALEFLSSLPDSVILSSDYACECKLMTNNGLKNL